MRARDTGEDSLGLDSQGQVYVQHMPCCGTMGVVDDGATMTTLYMLVAVVVAIIVIGSVSLIYNAFAISLSERSRYLGMLSSVGATKAAETQPVCFLRELVLGAIAIPIGTGLRHWWASASPFHFISPMMQQSFSLQADLCGWRSVCAVSWLMAVVISALTIFISAYGCPLTGHPGSPPSRPSAKQGISS